MDEKDIMMMEQKKALVRSMYKDDHAGYQPIMIKAS